MIPALFVIPVPEVGYIFGFIILVRSAFKIFTNKVSLSKEYTDGEYTRDRRYKSGGRFSGFKKFTHTVKADIKPKERVEIFYYVGIYIVIAMMYFNSREICNYVSVSFQPVKEYIKEKSDKLEELNRKQMEERNAAKNSTTLIDRKYNRESA